MFVIEPPSSREELVRELQRLDSEVTEHFAAIDESDFEAPQGEHWSPAVHLRHVTRSVRAVAVGMNKPRWLLFLLFGRSRTHRSYDEVVEVYRQALTAGPSAGRFEPSPEGPGQGVVIERWVLAGDGLRRAVSAWRDSALDQRRLPHPLLGKLTVREMLFFTLYHNVHHARRVVERAGG